MTEFPPALSVSELVRRLKGASSKIASDRGFPALSWQQGYVAFSVSRSSRDAVANYIRNQALHHAAMTSEPDAELPEFDTVSPPRAS